MAVNMYLVTNTKPMNSDIHLAALQTQTPYLQGALDLSDGPVVVEIPPAANESHLYGVISGQEARSRRSQMTSLTRT
jgi:hypothetical protein